MEIPIKDILVGVIPALIAAIVALVVIAYKSLVTAQRVREYKEDDFRQSIENRIIDLQQQLIVSRERFESVNHLLIEAQKAIISDKDDKKTRDGFFDSLGVNLNVIRDDELIFVIMPFNNEHYFTYKKIKESIEELGLRCKRGDEERLSSAILPYIIQEMVKARVIIADITGRNPNVLYELGIAHALNKQVLMIAQSSADIPFDVASVRVLIYKTGFDLSRELKKWLMNNAIKSV